jgi:hypothetical protein
MATNPNLSQKEQADVILKQLYQLKSEEEATKEVLKQSESKDQK